MSPDGHIRPDLHASDTFPGNTERGAASEWRVELRGNDPGLKALALLFRTPELRVTWGRDGTALLSWSELALLADPRDVWRRAQTLVTRMNATGILKLGQFEPVAVKRVFRRDEEGQEQGYAQKLEHDFPSEPDS